MANVSVKRMEALAVDHLETGQHVDPVGDCPLCPAVREDEQRPHPTQPGEADMPAEDAG